MSKTMRNICLPACDRIARLPLSKDMHEVIIKSDADIEAITLRINGQILLDRIAFDYLRECQAMEAKKNLYQSYYTMDLSCFWELEAGELEIHLKEERVMTVMVVHEYV